MKQTIFYIFLISKVFANEKNMDIHTIAECGHTNRDFKIVIQSQDNNFSEDADYYLSLQDNKLRIQKYEIDSNKLSFDIETVNDEDEINTDDFMQVINMKFPSLIVQSGSSKASYPLTINASWQNAQEECKKQSEEGRKATIGIASFAAITWFIYILDYFRKRRRIKK